MRKLTKDEVEFSVEIESEDMSVRGNAMASGDDLADKEVEDHIIARLNQGDVGAWCCIKVTAKWEEFEGFATLGGVSLSEKESSDKQAKEIAEDHGMHDEALDDLMKNINGYVMNAKDIQIKLAD